MSKHLQHPKNSKHPINPHGQKQSSTEVVNPMPAKRTNVQRRGIRKNKG